MQKTIPETMGNSSKSHSSIEIQDHLVEVFPDTPLHVLESSASLAHDIEDAVDMVVGGKQITLKDVVSRFQEKVKLDGNYFLKIANRNNTWREGLTFYKCALADHTMLTKKLSVEFEEEDGIDAGAIRIEFFSKFFSFSLKELFEEKNGYWIPKRSAGNLMLFKIIGLSVAHSILHNGPMFDALHPYCYILLLEKADEEVATHLTPELIPLNAGTANLVQFIDGISKCDTDGAIENMFNSEEGPAFEQIVNGSQWDILTRVTIANKETLLSMLIFEELVSKREKQMKAFREGFKLLHLFEIVKRNEKLFEAVFLANLQEITAEDLMRRFSFKFTTTAHEGNVISWFKDFVHTLNPEEMKQLLKFCTSLEKIPPYSDLRINIELLMDEGVLPKSSVCSNSLQLPIIHSNYEDFCKFMKLAFDCESEGFFEP